MKAKKYNNGGKTKKKESLERSPEQVRQNAVLYQSPKLSFEKRQEEAIKRRARNKRTNAINARRAEQRPDFKMPKPLDEKNLRDKDGSPLSGGSKAPISATKNIAAKTPKKALKKSRAVIPVPTKKEARKARRKKRN